MNPEFDLNMTQPNPDKPENTKFYPTTAGHTTNAVADAKKRFLISSSLIENFEKLNIGFLPSGFCFGKFQVLPESGKKLLISYNSQRSNNLDN